jgi:hypothetical protein
MLHGYCGSITKYLTRQEFDCIVGTSRHSQGKIEKLMEYIGATKLKGFSLRYIYFTDPKWRNRLNVPILPFSKIDELGAGMYKGENITQAERHAKKTEHNGKTESTKPNTA